MPSRLELPLAPRPGDLVPPPRFGEPVRLPDVGSSTSEPTRWDSSEDSATGDAIVQTHEAETSVLPDGVSTLYVGETLAMRASSRNPGEGRFENACEYRLDRDGRRIVVVADGSIDASAKAFDMAAHLRVELDGKPFFERSWREEIPRDLL